MPVHVSYCRTYAAVHVSVSGVCTVSVWSCMRVSLVPVHVCLCLGGMSMQMCILAFVGCVGICLCGAGVHSISGYTCTCV